MNSPLVSFIIPFYNSGETIQETIDSIFNQSYKNFDVWIINDGSTEINAIEKLKEFEINPQINILHQENAGPSVARNNAIKKTNADYILPLDSDNIINVKSIEKSLLIFEKNSQIDAVFGNFEFFGDKTEVKILDDFSIKKSFIYSQMDTCALIKKSVFSDGIIYDNYLSKIGLEDWEFWINFHLSNKKSKYSDFIFFKMRVSDQSRTFQVANKNLETIHDYVYKKHAVILAKEFNNLFYAFKMLKETPDYKIGNTLLKPWRFFKKLFTNYNIILF